MSIITNQPPLARTNLQKFPRVTVVVGEQRGDEGKGRFVDLLATEMAEQASSEGQAAIVVRYNGGPNAGHTVELPDKRLLKLHGLPSGVAHPTVMNVIGNGTLIDPVKLVEELQVVNDLGISVSLKNLMISSAAHLILPQHIEADRIRERGEGQQGSTVSGIAYAAADKALRVGKRAEDFKNNPDKIYEAIVAGLAAQADQRAAVGLESLDAKAIAAAYVEAGTKLGDYVTDTVLYLNRELRKPKSARILAESAQAFWLDVDHGMFPDTTSSSPISGGACIGLGIPPTFIDKVIGVVKATQSHVGGGHFVTEITDPERLDILRGKEGAVDTEKGVTTGRWRRMGNLDIAQLRRAQWVNGTMEMALSKLDCVPRYGDTVEICTSYTRTARPDPVLVAPDSSRKLQQCTPNYESLPTWTEDISEIHDYNDLPTNAQSYIERLEELTGVPITMIGVGPGREEYIKRSA